MRVRLLLQAEGKFNRVFAKDYPLAVDEDEARSMMFRDHEKDIMYVMWLGGRIQYNIEKLDTACQECDGTGWS